MSWNIKAKLKQTLKAEEGSIIKDRGGKATYLLIYPNTYHVGMSNLGVHNVYRILNERDDVVCERAFLPEKADLKEHKRTNTPILSYESQRPINEFDIIAFSVAYENDIPNIQTILELSKIKKGFGPKLIVGGAAVTLNPKLFERQFDEVITGNFEGSGSLPARSAIWTRDTEFGSMHLVEVQRGCPHRCRFCAAPVIYSPFKQFSKEEVVKAIDVGLPYRKKIGLIGGDVLGHKDFIDIAEYIHSKGATFSPSSVRADRINRQIAELLKISGHRTITLAPEAGSEALRRAIGKNIPDEKFFEAASLLGEHGIRQIKLYFMMGLPRESDADVRAIVEFVKRVKGQGASGKITVAVNPFVPKVRTLFAGERFAELNELKVKIARLKKDIGKIGGVMFKAESPVQALREYEWQK
ncbi:MAG: hypothetical protein COV46_07765 [Deltaproteobacteria bacterium CG11_big_fil_rev_8_21_14_0_20_49_13]|nr:MAG: hypothetical protein COV46_07765 [Deltaproteobacteria bacterium CG11_big_fil_rev_8_21_14_0_20_49_13]